MTLTLPINNGYGQPLKISFKKFFFPLLLFIVVIVVFIKLSELREIGRLFAQAKWHWLVLAFVSQLINIALQTKVYRAIFRILKFPRFDFKKLVKTVITVVFLNFTIPSLGFAGNIFFVKILKQHGIKEGRAVMSIIMEFVCYYIAFSTLLILSLFYLFFKLGNIGYAQKIAIGGFVIMLLLVTYITYFFLGDKKKSHRRVAWFLKKVYTCEDGITHQEKARELIDDFHYDFKWLKKNKNTLVKPSLIQFIKFLSDGLTIYLLFLAFGTVVPIGLGVVAFALGRLFGYITFIPGGLGAFEGSMVLIFHSLGVHLELSLAITLIYRFFSYWLYFPLGLFFYKHLDKK